MSRHNSLLQRLKTGFDKSTQNNDLSFENFLQAEVAGSSHNGTSPGIDNIFNPIQINSQSYSSRCQIPKKDINILKSNQKQSKLLHDREEVKKRFEQLKPKSKEKPKKQPIIIHQKQIEFVQAQSRKQQKYLQLQIQQLKQEIEKERNKLYKLNNINMQLNQTIKSLQNQVYFLKEDHKKVIKSKQQAIGKSKGLEGKIRSLEEKLENVEKNLKVKERQVKKMGELHQESSNNYMNMFKQKQQQIQKLKSEIDKKNTQILNLCNSQQTLQQKTIQLSSQLSEAQQQLQLCQQKQQHESHQNSTLLQKLTQLLHNSLQTMQRYLQQLNQNQNNGSNPKILHFQNIQKNIQRKYHSVGGAAVDIDQMYCRRYLEVVGSVVDVGRVYAKKKVEEIRKFQQSYNRQIEDIGINMNLLIQENNNLKHIIQQRKVQQKLRISSQPQIINKTIAKPPQISSNSEHNLHRFDPQQFRNFMSCARAHHNKIKSEVENTETAKILCQVQKARKIYNETTFRSQSVLAQQKYIHNCASESNIHRRQRKSLSWKRPSNILRDYA